MLSYRTGAEKLFNRLNDESSASIIEVQSSKLLSMETRLGPFFNYSLTQECVQILSDSGVYLSPNSFISHSHPASKTLENHFLYVEALQTILSLVGNMNFHVNLVSIRKQKFLNLKKFFREAGKSDDVIRQKEFDLHLINRCLSGRDSIRYSCSSGVSNITNSIEALLSRSPRLMRDNLGYFLHDELHYWSLSNMNTFLTRAKPEFVVATIVVPPEIIEGVPFSLNPDLYSFSIRDERSKIAVTRDMIESFFKQDRLYREFLGGAECTRWINFFPDGCRNESYTQPLFSIFWLRIRNLICEDGTSYSVDITRSIGAHHLIVLKKNSMSSERERHFNSFTHVPSYSILRGFDVHTCPVRIKFLKSVLSYILCLKKADVESGLAKCRQHLDEGRCMNEFIFLGDITKAILTLGVGFKNGKPNFSDWAKRVFLDQVSDSEFGSMIAARLLSKDQLWKKILEIGSFNISFCLFDANFQKPVDFKDLFTSNEGVVEDEGFFDNVFSVGITQNEKSNLYYVAFGGQNVTEVTEFDSRFIAIIADNSILRDSRVACKYSLASSARTRPFNWSKRRSSCYILFKNRRSKTKAAVKMVRHSMIRMLVHFFSNSFTGTKFLSNSPFVDDAIVQIMNDGSSSSRSPFTRIYYYDDDVDITCDDYGYEIVNTSNIFFDMDICEEIGSPASQPANIGSNEQPIVLFDDLTNNCCFSALMECLNITESFMLQELSKQPNNFFMNKLMMDQGLTNIEAQKLFEFFNSNLVILSESGVINHIINSEWITSFVEIKDNHCRHLSKSEIKKVKMMQSMNQLDSSGFGQKISDLAKVKLIDFQLAKKLNRAFSLGRTGVMLKGSNASQGGAVPDKVFSVMGENSSTSSLFETKIMNSISVETIFGFAGSGKTMGLTRSLQGINERVLIIVPRVNLKNHWDNEVGKLPNRNMIDVMTFETVFKKTLSDYGMVIIDEHSLFPKGYAALISIKLAIDCGMIGIKRGSILFDADIDLSIKMILIGDPMQIRFFDEKALGFLDDGSDIDLLLDGENIDYLFLTKRLSKPLAGRLFEGLPSASRLDKGGVTFKNRIENFTKEELKRYGAILCASRADKMYCSAYGNAMTFGESQGLSFDRVMICLSSDSMVVSQYHAIVALTRARVEVAFFFLGIDRKDDYSSRSRNLLGWALNTPIQKHQLLKILPASSNVNLIEKIGLRTLDEKEEKLSGDPFLKSILPLFDDLDLCEVTLSEPECVEPNMKIHVPIEGSNIPLAINFERIKLKEDREIIDGNAMSEQFPDCYRAFESSDQAPGPYRFLAIYPRHRNNDQVTFWAAVKKRLSFSNPRDEMEKLRRASNLGEIMFKHFIHTYKLRKKHFDRNIYESCISDYVDKKLSKPTGTIESHSKRSDTDWELNDILLFIKSQICTKFEKRFCDGKAGQTLACFSHFILNRFSGPCRYIEKVFTEQLDDRFYIHQKKDFNQLNDWVKRRCFDSEGTESDYEAFDRSQDAIILAFELKLLAFFGWSEDLIEDYKVLKLNLGCKLGNFSIMRFTGEFCTFLFNTFANMVFTSMRYHFDDASICFAGDDMCANRRLRLRHDYDCVLDRLSLKAKVDFVENPTFCGWRLSKFGIFKSPQIINERIEIARERNMLDMCLDGYATELSYAYVLGERLFGILNEEECSYHYKSVRFVIKNRHRLRSSIRELYSSKTEIGCLKLKDSGEHYQMMEGESLIFNHQMFTNIRSSGSRENIFLEDLKTVSKSKQVTLMKPPSSEASTYLMTLSLNLRKVSVRLTSMFTLEQSLSRYMGCLELTKESLEHVDYMTVDGLMKIKQELHCLILTSMTKLHLVPFAPITVYQLMIHTYQIQLNVCCNFTISICSLNQEQYQLILEPYVLIQMIQKLNCLTFLMTVVVSEPFRMSLKIRRVSCLNTLVLEKIACLMCSAPEMKLKLKIHCLDLERLDQEEKFQMLEKRKFLMTMLDLVARLAHPLAIGLLGYPEVNLKGTSVCLKRLVTLDIWIERVFYMIHTSLLKTTSRQAFLKLLLTELKGKMALTAEQMANLMACVERIFPLGARGSNYQMIRNYVVAHCYPKHIRTANLNNRLPNPNAAADWNDVDVAAFRSSCNHFFTYVFGYLSEYGFAPNTTYPTVVLEIPTLGVTINGANNANEVYQIFADQIDFDFGEFTSELKGAMSQQPSATLNRATFRNVGESFGPEIYRYLKDINPDAPTAARLNCPLMVQSAPWMGTDAIDGIVTWRGRNLSENEIRVVQRSKHWLLKSIKARHFNVNDEEAVMET